MFNVAKQAKVFCIDKLYLIRIVWRSGEKRICRVYRERFKNKYITRLKTNAPKGWVFNMY
jgi:hypothetical protein